MLQAVASKIESLSVKSGTVHNVLSPFWSFWGDSSGITNAEVKLAGIPLNGQKCQEPEGGGGGGGGGWRYSHTLPIRVCAAHRGRDFEAPDLERGIHFRGVF